MLFERTDRAADRVRLGYCMNLHPADSVDGVCAGLERVTRPLRARLEESGDLAAEASFGVGMYLPAAAAAALARDPAELERLAGALRAGQLDPFTYNAFPFGGFHSAGLKRGVFRPTWSEPERLAYTLDVARCAVELDRRLDLDEPAPHIAISTHAGCHADDLAGDFDAQEADRQLVRALRGLAELEAETGRRVVLSVEPEPRSRANDTGQWAEQTAAFLVGLTPAERDLAERHLGLCLDACHAAVECEPEPEAAARAAAVGLPLGKLQFSSAIELHDPARHPGAVEQLLALDEAVYLHQVTGSLSGAAHARCGDLGELAAELGPWLAGESGSESPPQSARWRTCDRWRCHFHVPVDLSRTGDAEAPSSNLATTVASADRLLDALLEDPRLWGTPELAVEIETYTWDVLPDAARGPGSLLDGLEREYRHVLARLSTAGFRARS